MFDFAKDIISRIRHKRMLTAWAKVLNSASELDFQTLRKMRSVGQQQRRLIGQFIFKADSRLTMPYIGTKAMRKPLHCDWAYRPEIWSGPLPKIGMAVVETQTKVGNEATIFHDCRISEMTYRQIRNTRETDLSPFALRMDIFRFDGGFLSVVIEVPKEAAQDLKLNHIIRVETLVEMEKPLEIFARLNIKHGPNTEQIVREMPLSDEEVNVEFDLAYTKINEKRVERIWLDLIFEGPEMNQVILRDLTLTRRPRSEL